MVICTWSNPAATSGSNEMQGRFKRLSVGVDPGDLTVLLGVRHQFG